MMAEADVLQLSFDYGSGHSGVTDIRKATPTSVLSCFMPVVTNLTVYWSEYDEVLRIAPYYPNTIWTSCGNPDPRHGNIDQRLGFKGMLPATLSSPPYTRQLYNVGYSQYYK